MPDVTVGLSKTICGADHSSGLSKDNVLCLQPWARCSASSVAYSDDGFVMPGKRRKGYFFSEGDAGQLLALVAHAKGDTSHLAKCLVGIESQRVPPACDLHLTVPRYPVDMSPESPWGDDCPHEAVREGGYASLFVEGNSSVLDYGSRAATIGEDNNDLDVALVVTQLL